MDEIISRDQNFITTLAGITNDANQYITMLRVDPVTKRLLVQASGSGAGVTSINGLTGAVILAAGTGISLGTVGNTITITNTGGSPSLPLTSVQFNDGGVFGGNAGFTFDKTLVNVNIGNAVTTNQRTVRIGQDTSFVDIGSRVGATTQGAMYINTTTPSSSNFVLACDGTNTLLNSPTGNSTTTFLSGGSTYMIGSANAISFQPSATSTAAVTPFTFTRPNSTNQTASTEVNGLVYASATLTWATGAITTQREIWDKAQTYAFAGASVITNAYTRYIDSPIAGTNATITNSWALGTGGNAQFLVGSTTQGIKLTGLVGTLTTSAIYMDNASPSASNFTLRSSVTQTILNSTTTTSLSVSNTSYLDITANTISFPVSGTALNWNASNVVLTHSSGILTLGTGTLKITTPTNTTTSVMTIDGTQTVSNKRRVRRVVVTTQSATPTINTDNTDVSSITGLAQAITSFTSNLSGTPVNDGDQLEIQITDNGTARAITWGTSFASTTVTLPTTTVISTRLRVFFEWNTVTSKWDCVGTC